MKNDLISRSALLEIMDKRIKVLDREATIHHTFKRLFGYDEAREEVQYAPAVDAEPVRRGKWIAASLDPDDPYFNCSECMCGFSTIYHEGEEMKHCPNCGAKMDMEVSDENA